MKWLFGQIQVRGRIILLLGLFAVPALLSPRAWGAPAEDAIQLSQVAFTLQAELEGKKRALAQAEAHRQQLALRLQSENHRILTLKNQRRSGEQQGELEKLLASALARANELDSVAKQQLALANDIEALNKRLLAACDRALVNAPAEMDRLGLSRLRAQAVQDLSAADKPNSKLAQCAAHPSECTLARVSIDELDGAQELNRKADLLSDSADKLKREIKRIADRIQEVEEREHLRRRMMAIDEDLFSENLTSRTITRPSASTSTSTTPPNQGLSVGDSRGPATSGNSTASATQPSTVPLQKRTHPEETDLDPADFARYLRRLQTEFSDLARRSEERARALRKRAEALAGQK